MVEADVPSGRSHHNLLTLYELVITTRTSYVVVVSLKSR